MASSLASAVNTFAFDLLKVLSQDNEENVFFSPLSIFTALNMVALGAKGRTSEEMFEKLRCNKAASSYQELHEHVKKTLEGYSKDDLPYALYLANKLLIQKGEPILDQYQDTLASHYKATTDAVDFEDEGTVDHVNAWVKEQTRGTISVLLDKIQPGIVAILLNAIYFKGKWCNPFDPEKTVKDLFYNHGMKESSKRVEFMHKSSLRCRLKSYKIGREKTNVLEIPYEGGISMCIILSEALDGLNRIMQNVQFPQDLKPDIFDIHHEADVWLPRWKFETKYELKKCLENLGLKDCFVPAAADFSGIFETKGLFISNIFHKAAIEVNEEGTVAAAATIVAVRRCLKKQCKVNRPFIFYIKDTKSDLILFMGAVRSL